VGIEIVEQLKVKALKFRNGTVRFLYLEIGFRVRRFFVVFGLYDKVFVSDLPGRGLEDALG
jgi:uncharacterized protein with GYD domain